MRFLRTNTALSLDMGPTRSINDSPDIPSCEAKRICDGLMSLTTMRQCSDHLHKSIRQGSSMMILAFLAAVLGHVTHVTATAIPTKVVDVVVAGVSINMASLLPVAAWANECLQYKVMDVALSATTQGHDKAVVVIHRRSDAARLKLPPCSSKPPFTSVACPYGSVGADTIARTIDYVAVDYSHISSVTQVPGAVA